MSIQTEQQPIKFLHLLAYSQNIVAKELIMVSKKEPKDKKDDLTFQTMFLKQTKMVHTFLPTKFPPESHDCQSSLKS